MIRLISVFALATGLWACSDEREGVAHPPRISNPEQPSVAQPPDVPSRPATAPSAQHERKVGPSTLQHGEFKPGGIGKEPIPALTRSSTALESGKVLADIHP